MSARVSSTSGTNDESPVPDLTHDHLQAVMESDHHALRAAVRRVTDELESKNQHYAAFNNAP